MLYGQLRLLGSDIYSLTGCIAGTFFKDITPNEGEYVHTAGKHGLARE